MLRFALGLRGATFAQVAKWPRWVVWIRAITTGRKPGYTFWEW
jgi:hypothetical protein